MSKNKIGFWSVFAIVIGSQVGTGVFITPISLAPFGIYTLAGWLIAGIGAIALSLVFASLCSSLPQTGGPHVYVEAAFGRRASFFIGWTYWVISWVSTTAVIKGCIGYLTPLIGYQVKEYDLVLELILLFTIMLLNLRGLDAAGKVEFILTAMKFIPLIFIPIAAIPYFSFDNFVVSQEIAAMPLPSLLGKVTLLTLWGFVGLECSTSAAGSVESPGKTIPRAIILGTATVAAIYLINSMCVMGVVSGPELSVSQAPYVEVASKIFGNNISMFMALISCIICIGTLNAWILVSGQIALGLAQSGLLPKLFAYRNSQDAPSVSIIFSTIGIVPLLLMTANESLAEQVTLITDFSVTAFLFVYLACCLAFFKLHISNSSLTKSNTAFGLIATLFCCWVIFETSAKTLLIASSFTLSALPLYLSWYKKSNK